jgi:prepilin-type N-terminal cleavage/methylation domain-containing protein
MSLPKKKFQFSIFNFQFKPGFSLIELLVVIAIMGILISFSSASWTNVQQKSRDGQRKSDIKAVQQALESYYQQYGQYPPGDVNGRIRCDLSSSGIDWGNAFTCGSNTYIQRLPSDPIFLTNSLGQYRYGGNATSYTIYAKLENSSDPDLLTDPCILYPPPRNYCVIQP